MLNSPITEVRKRISELRASGGRAASREVHGLEARATSGRASSPDVHGLAARATKKGPPPLLQQRERRQWRYLRPQDLVALKDMLFAARLIVEGTYTGRHKSPFKGSAPEFADHRQYCPGDEMRTVDWRVFARSDRYFVKRFEQETDVACSIFLDASASMAYRGYEARTAGRGGLSKYDYGAYLAAALAFLMVKQGDKAGLTIFDTQIRSHAQPAGTFAHLYNMLDQLERTKPTQQTSISSALTKAYGLLRRKGLVIVISDLLDEPEDVFKALSRYTHRGFEVLLFHVMHEDELTLPVMPSADFIDAEMDARMTCNPDDLRVNYVKEVHHFIEIWERNAKARRIDYHFVTTATPYQEVLQKYLARRGQR
ncbi:MAG: DUF58 domain-containing protein [Candidatus Hydrogenedentales bacterium]